ncbi:hypothetical protein [Salinimonas lutimaris]|uniref:hypothetical protein n=1 Tax=Salinimonas lutimaris TaxID=914153 RepID=UPI0010C13D0E|nr:hypothetical protein [Salinimonas lutimaris]
MIFAGGLLIALCGLCLLEKWLIIVWIRAESGSALIRVYSDLPSLICCRKAWHIPAGMVTQISVVRRGLILNSGPYELARISAPAWLLPGLAKAARQHFLLARVNRVWDW